MGLFVAYLLERRWGTVLDTGWSDWDVEVHGHPWTLLRVATAEEDHGGGKRLIRVRYRLRPTNFARAAAALGVILLGVTAAFHAVAAAVGAGVLTALLLAAWWRGRRLAGRVAAAFDGLARGQGLVRCEEGMRDEG